MKNITNISPELPGIAYDGSLTFVGVLRRYFVDYDQFGNNNGISKNWNDNTKSSFIADYENRLLPALIKLFGKEKPMHSYVEEEFEQIIDYLNQQHHYAESTLLHYRHLLWVVYQIGFKHDLYADNIFWDEIIDLCKKSVEIVKEARG